MTIVLKFGGSSISKIGFDKIINLLNKNKYIIVLSALSKTTDLLLEYIKKKDISIINKIKDNHNKLLESLDLNNKLLDDIFDKLLDCKSESCILGYGEYLSTLILYNYLKKNNIVSYLADTSKFIKSELNSYEIKSLSIQDKIIFNKEYLLDKLKFTNIIITQGYVISSNDNKRYVLSRGGSDTTASLIASNLNSEKLEIWTDVNGLYNGHPNYIQNCDIIQNIDYKLCQEMAAMGAKVLHPYCIQPCYEKNIPIYIKNTYSNNKINTKIYKNQNNVASALLLQNDIFVFRISSLKMWDSTGFISDIFGKFAKYGINIDIINTSQFEVLATTNTNININKLKCELEEKYKVKLYQNCSIISYVSNKLDYNIFNYINDNSILIKHISSNNMCISIVLKNIDLYFKLYNQIYKKWWINKKLILNNRNSYIYNLSIVKQQCFILRDNLSNINNFYYAIKANSNINILNEIYKNGFNFECVSIEEVRYIKKHFNDAKILFSPNYCYYKDYNEAIKLGSIVIFDNYELLNKFKNIEIAVRLDLNMGDGHHKKVITEGKESKFGIQLSDIDVLVEICKKNNIKIIGLHSHRGSGINDINNWIKTIDKLNKLKDKFDNIKWFDIGGGFGLKLKDHDFKKLNNYINNFNTEIIIEPGRYLVSDAGILVSKVNLVKSKGNKHFIGINTGMNSLIRPMLYNAYHKIYNYSSMNEIHNIKYDVVGPICESGDILGKNRLLPKTEIDDIIVIENCGAYGYTMSNDYNMKDRISEIIF